MKILIYGVNYAPELTGIGKYSGEMAEWLVEQGHDVRVVTAPPYYPEWQVTKGYTNTYRKEKVEGVDVYRCPLYVPKQPSGLKRIIHLASFAISSLPIMLKQAFWKPDMVMVIEPPLFCAPTAWVVARLSGAKCCLHIQDFEVDAAFELGIIPFASLQRLISWLEIGLMKRFDVVSTISNSMLQRLQNKGVQEPVLFPNWADLSRVQFMEDGRQAFRHNLGIDDATCLCLYSGNIAVKQGLDILLDVAKELPDSQFVICGDGANRQALEDSAKKYGLNNLKFLPLQPLEKLSAMLSAADIHLVIQKKGAADLVMPSKLTNIFAVGGLALVTAEEQSELGRLADKPYSCVYRCNPEDTQALIEAIITLHQDQVLCESIKKQAMTYAAQYIGKRQVLDNFQKKLQEVVS